MEVEFIKEKLEVIGKISNELLSDYKLNISACDNDFADDISTYRLSASIYANMSEERQLTYKCKRPSFFDWLFRRREIATFNLVVKDLLNAKKVPERTERIYIIN